MLVICRFSPQVYISALSIELSDCTRLNPWLLIWHFFKERLFQMIRALVILTIWALHKKYVTIERIGKSIGKSVMQWAQYTKCENKESVS